MNKNLTKIFARQFLSIFLATTALAFSFEAAYAIESNTLPSGEKIVLGEASFDRETPNVLNIKQESDRLFIDWTDGFDIGRKAATRFYQPSNESIVVNRVTGKSKDPTKILGELSANGRVIILDNNGIIFGKSSHIDVGGLIASTGQIDLESFAKNDKTVTIQKAVKGSIINKGHITLSDAGLATFVAPNVRNDGLIVARKGTIIMGQAQIATLDFYGDSLLEIKVGEKLKGTDIRNTGKIDNEGGRVFVTAAYVDKTVREMVNMSEISKGETFRVRNGKIIIGKVDSLPTPAPNPEPVLIPVTEVAPPAPVIVTIPVAAPPTPVLVLAPVPAPVLVSTPTPVRVAMKPKYINWQGENGLQNRLYKLLSVSNTKTKGELTLLDE